MQSAILWHLTDPFSTERCTATLADDAPRFAGVVLHLAEGHPCYTSYRITLDAQWRTRDVDIRTTALHKDRALHLTANGGGNWWLNDSACPALDGCIDIDLGITPATNTLPIRRLGLQPGQSAELDAAWVRFPELTIERLPQRYTCLAPDRYRYESANFAATLTVDAHGLVRDYEGLWRAVAAEEA